MNMGMTCTICIKTVDGCLGASLQGHSKPVGRGDKGKYVAGKEHEIVREGHICCQNK